MNFETYLLTKNFNLMKRTKVKLLTAMFLFAAFLFVQDAQAQSLFANEVSSLSAKSGVDASDFYSGDDATNILKAEVTALNNAAANLNGGSVEAENSLKTRFYRNIVRQIKTSDNVLEAIQISVPDLVQNASHMNVPVNTQGIIDGVVVLLTL